MPTPPTHERLVAGLVADARPVRPLWSPHTRLALWLVLQVLTLGVAVEFGLRQDLGDHLRQPHFLFEVGALVAAGAMGGGGGAPRSDSGDGERPFDGDVFDGARLGGDRARVPRTGEYRALRVGLHGERSSVSAGVVCGASMTRWTPSTISGATHGSGPVVAEPD